MLMIINYDGKCLLVDNLGFYNNIISFYKILLKFNESVLIGSSVHNLFSYTNLQHVMYRKIFKIYIYINVLTKIFKHT